MTKDWYGDFADGMGIPWTIQEQIKENFSIIEDQKKAMAEYWVTTLHDASWITLAGVLYHVGELSALQEVKDKFLKEDEGIGMKDLYLFSFLRKVEVHMH